MGLNPGPLPTREDLVADIPCCYGSAFDGPLGCTCWRPVFDMDQLRADRDSPVTTNRQMCGDCAYRPDSRERQMGEDMEAMDNFWCHRGVKRAIGWVHPDGRRRTADPADYQPLFVDGGMYRASGRRAARCAGWAAHMHELASVG